ncbi:hypothetical protein ACCS72_38980, partial [Rhizobium ruizarguesonis]
AEAETAFGICGIKVWIFKGEILEHDPMASERRAMEVDAQGPASRDRDRDRDRRRDNALAATFSYSPNFSATRAIKR